MNETFEYAIKKDVRNNPIIREVDVERHREMWQSVAIGVFVVLAALFSGVQHFELLRHGYELEKLQKARGAEEALNRQLRLEVQTLRTPSRIERIATTRLNMRQPGPGESSVIERTTPAPAPPRSVVARR